MANLSDPSTPFVPTHTLVSRTRRVPVLVQSKGDCSWVYTEAEWGQAHAPAFELRPKLGMSCQGVPVLGYRLEPLTAENTAAPAPTEELSLRS